MTLSIIDIALKTYHLNLRIEELSRTLLKNNHLLINP